MILPKNIMIVEDEVITQRHLKDILEQNNVNMIKAFDNGTDVMEALKDHSFDMILMDINIKGSTDGIRLAKNILDNHALPIVFITAYCDNTTLDEALVLSPYGFIAKPFSEQDVLIMLQVAYKRFLVHKKTDSDRHKEHLDHHIKINEYFTYSLALSTLYYNKKPVRLNIRQNSLIKILCKNINNTVSKEALTTSIWEKEVTASSSLRNLVYSIRKIFPDLPIHSHSKMGYSIEGQYS